MDLREKKTRRSIRAAFLELLGEKPIERITVKELAERAEVGKATFYLHYRSVYDLRDQLRRALVDEVVDRAVEAPGSFDDSAGLVSRLFDAFDAQHDLVELLFPGDGSPGLAALIERAIRAAMLAWKPELDGDVQFEMLLTYMVMGGFGAYGSGCRRFPRDEVVEVLAEASERIAQLMGERAGTGAH